MPNPVRIDRDNTNIKHITIHSSINTQPYIIGYTFKDDRFSIPSNNASAVTSLFGTPTFVYIYIYIYLVITYIYSRDVITFSKSFAELKLKVSKRK